MKINVTAEQLAAAIQSNEEALVHAIRDCGKSHPPGDGTIGLLAGNLRALREMRPTAERVLRNSEKFPVGSQVAVRDDEGLTRVGVVTDYADYERIVDVRFRNPDETLTLPAARLGAAAADDVDVGANEQTGERVTVKKRVAHGRKDG